MMWGFLNIRMISMFCRLITLWFHQERLVEAMKMPLSRMTDDEKARNTHGPCIIGSFDPDNTKPYPSSMPGVFPDLNPCLTKCVSIELCLLDFAMLDLTFFTF